MIFSKYRERKKTMKLIIELPNDFNDYIEDVLMYIGERTEILVEAVANGTPLQEELESIKAEIEADSKNRTSEEQIGMEYATDIIDNHINQADCNNDCEHCEWTECPKD